MNKKKECIAISTFWGMSIVLTLILAAVGWVNAMGYFHLLPLSRFGEAICFMCR